MLDDLKMKESKRGLHQSIYSSGIQESVRPTAAQSTFRGDLQWIATEIECIGQPMSIRSVNGYRHHVLPPSVRLERSRHDLLRLWSRAEHRSTDAKRDVAANSDVQTMLSGDVSIERIADDLWDQ